MNLQTFAKTICAWSALLLVSGCLQLPKPEPVEVRHFVLPDLTAQLAADSESEWAPATVGLLLDLWPEYLHRQQLVLFANAVELQILEDFRWAEPLRAAFLNRTLLALQRRYPQTQWQATPWTIRPPDLLCVIEIHDWRAHTNGTISLSASWRLVERATGAVLNAAEFQDSSEWSPMDLNSLVVVKGQQLISLAQSVQAAMPPSE